MSELPKSRRLLFREELNSYKIAFEAKAAAWDAIETWDRLSNFFETLYPVIYPTLEDIINAPRQYDTGNSFQISVTLKLCAECVNLRWIIDDIEFEYFDEEDGSDDLGRLTSLFDECLVGLCDNAEYAQYRKFCLVFSDLCASLTRWFSAILGYVRKVEGDWVLKPEFFEHERDVSAAYSEEISNVMIEVQKFHKKIIKDLKDLNDLPSSQEK